METYHYSILFHSCGIRHHGEFDSAFSDEKQIVRKAKKHCIFDENNLYRKNYEADIPETKLIECEN